MDKSSKDTDKFEAKLIQIIVDAHGVRQQTFGYENNDVKEILQRTEAILLSGADNLLKLGLSKEDIMKSFEHIVDVLKDSQDYKEVESDGGKNE